MYALNLIMRSEGVFVDSRDVAEVLGKSHKHLLRDIHGYIEVLKRPIGPGADPEEYFVPSCYMDWLKRNKPCYLITEKGCELIAKQTPGDKGLLLTALYTAKFGQVKAAVEADVETPQEPPETETEPDISSDTEVTSHPRLCEFNRAAQIVVRAMQNAGASSGSIVQFLRDLYEPHGIAIADENLTSSTMPTYTATQIAETHGVYSQMGNPHAQAVSCILNEKIFIGNSHKTIVPIEYTDCKWGGVSTGISVQYDEYAMQAVIDWLRLQGYPNKVRGNDRTYKILYDWDFID